MEIEIINDDLNKEVYRFYQNGMVFKLNSYTKETRQTKRHKWKIELLYDSVFKRKSDIQLHEITIPSKVVNLVIEKAINEIQVIK